MSPPPRNLRDDAIAIWNAGVAAVAPQRLLAEWLEFDGDVLRVGDDELDIKSIGRLAVVGAGKAGAGMALAVENVLGPHLLEQLNVSGWVDVPEDCVRPTQRIHLHPAHPAGVDEPTDEGVRGAGDILRIAGSLTDADVCLCLISGGGSALLPAPVDGFTLADKAEITRAIAARGGDIQQLNAVRRELSRIKGGGLARACRAGRLFTLILSDVLGDDLATIASGPTVIRKPTPLVAMDALQQLRLDELPAGRRAMELLQQAPTDHALDPNASTTHARVTNLVIGNNATAVDAAGMEAERRGYSHAMVSANAPEGHVDEVANRLAPVAQRMRTEAGPDCLISGGEPTVELVPQNERGLGGRNQQLCLEAAVRIDDWRGIAFLSGGTDGEDGPTDAAGAVVDLQVVQEGRSQELDARDFLRRNDAYRYFEKAGGLIKTGPTHTNVCDLRVITVDRSAR